QGEYMKIAFYSSKHYDKESFELANKHYGFELEFFDFKLNNQTVNSAKGFDAVCVFVNDEADQYVLQQLAAMQIKILALRCAGFDNVDLEEASRQQIKVVRVPAYSPEAVAEHAVALMMTLNRHIHKAYQRTRDANFSLEGLTGFNMYGKT